jgi:UrcA family protein
MSLKLTRSLRNVSVLAMALFGLAGAAPAQTVETHSLAVRYDDLDLRTAAGVAAFQARIARAAAAVCGPVDHRSLREIGRYDACRDAAIHDAGPKLDMAIALAKGGPRYALNDAGAR